MSGADSSEATQRLRAQLEAARQRVRDLERELAEHQLAPGLDDATFTHTLLSHLRDFVYFKDHERRFVRFSDSFEELLGRPASEIVGRRDEELFPPEIANETIEDDRRVIEHGIPVVNKLEGGLVSPGVERWVLTTKLPWRDANGTIRGLFGVSRDFTTQKKLEDDLKDSERRLRIISDTVPIPVAVTRVDNGVVLYANHSFAQFVGLPLRELVGARIPDYYADPRQRDEILATALAHGRVEGAEIRLRRHDGEIRTASSFILPLTIDGVPALMGAGADITDLKHREQELRELSAQKDLLLREVNHRVRNNLAALAALIAQRMVATEGPAREALERIAQGVQGLSAVHGMLSETGWQPLSIAALCRQVIHASLRGVQPRPSVEVSNVMHRVSSHPAHQLALALSELATNSAKHAGQRDQLEIDVTLQSTNEGLRLTYRDNGKGFPESVLHRNAWGLGLRLLEQIVSHGLAGSVTLSNDEGAVTELHLPELEGNALAAGRER